MSIPEYLVSVLGLIVLAFITFRIIVRRSYLRRRRLTWFSTILETLVFFLFATSAWLDLISGSPPVPSHPVLRIIGWLCILIGLPVMFIVIFWFKWLRAMGRKVDVLIQSGPYRYTRNPQIIACAVAVFGSILIWPSWHTAGWVVLFAIIAHMMVLTEEEHLRNVFGDDYEKYCNSVSRYFGLRKKTE